MELAVEECSTLDKSFCLLSVLTRKAITCARTQFSRLLCAAELTVETKGEVADSH